MASACSSESHGERKRRNLSLVGRLHGDALECPSGALPGELRRTGTSYTRRSLRGRSRKREGRRSKSKSFRLRTSISSGRCSFRAVSITPSVSGQRKTIESKRTWKSPDVVLSSPTSGEKFFRFDRHSTLDKRLPARISSRHCSDFSSHSPVTLDVYSRLATPVRVHWPTFHSKTLHEHYVDSVKWLGEELVLSKVSFSF